MIKDTKEAKKIIMDHLEVKTEKQVIEMLTSGDMVAMVDTLSSVHVNQYLGMLLDWLSNKDGIEVLKEISKEMEFDFKRLEAGLKKILQCGQKHENKLLLIEALEEMGEKME